MTSTTSKARFGDWRDWIFIGAKSALLVYAAVLLAMAGCNAPQQPAAKNRVPTIIPAEIPPPPPPPAAAPEPEKKDDSPYYGSTYWDELLTSVYYYPDAGDQLEEGPPSLRGSAAIPATHLKFNHREDDVWLCGDQRKSFEPGNRYRLLVTFELGQPCITNWKIK